MLPIVIFTNEKTAVQLKRMLEQFFRTSLASEREININKEAEKIRKQINDI